MSEKLDIQTILRESSLTTKVTEQLEQFILNGNLQANDRFPPERTLAEKFGVSRTVIREAVKALVSKELLVVKPGSGTFVNKPSSSTVSRSIQLYLQTGEDLLDYFQVHEARRLFEVEIAGLAAERHTDEDIRKLEGILAMAEKIEADREQFTQLDVDFYAALAQATHNRVYVMLVNSLTEIMLQVRREAFAVPNTPSRALVYHRLVFEQVRAGNKEAARNAMLEHMQEAEETMQRAFELRLAEKAIQKDNRESK